MASATGGNGPGGASGADGPLNVVNASYSATGSGPGGANPSGQTLPDGSQVIDDPTGFMNGGGDAADPPTPVTGPGGPGATTADGTVPDPDAFSSLTGPPGAAGTGGDPGANPVGEPSDSSDAMTPAVGTAPPGPGSTSGADVTVDVMNPDVSDPAGDPAG